MSTRASASGQAPRIARRRRAWTWVLGSVTLVLLAASGFLNGTVEWYIPWPATDAEEAVYYTARDLLWSGWAGIALTGVAAGLSRPDLTTALRIGVAIGACVGISVLGLTILVAASEVGREHFLFALTR